MKLKILVLCTGNSCRSQMAEGFFRHYSGDKIEVKSAGLEPKGVNPLAIKVMKEVGVDISGHRSKHLNEYLNEDFDYVITVCDNAAANCPVFPSRPASGRGGHGEPVPPQAGLPIRLHWPFPDPSTALVRQSSPQVGTCPVLATGSESEILRVFRKVRDDIEKSVKQWPELLFYRKQNRK